jgi:hypothetical protein
MELLPAPALDFFREFLEDESLLVSAFTEFGADKPDYRARLRAQSELAKSARVSRSHSTTAGGFAQSARADRGLGFDLETTARITLPVVRRISTAEELQAAGSVWPRLWVAKEACFKALQGPQQPKLVSDLHIGGWQRQSSQFDTCVLLQPERFQAHDGRGAIYWNPQFIFGVFSIRWL